MLSRQIKIFIFVGFITVSVDFLIYKTLLSFMLMQVDLAKGVGFVGGTLFSYFANRFWTFSSPNHPKRSAVRFVVLYCLTLVINILVNAGVLSILSESIVAENVAFLLATGTSAVINFLGMKWLVFNLNFGKPKV